MSCKDCGARSHKAQVKKYPIGSRVVAITDIHSGSLPLIPFGATGSVTDHCHDGRAWVRFDHFDGGHTFHFPEQNIAAEWKA